MKLIIDTTTKGQPISDLYGIFFEDLNHAADGGLYAELIRNRAFEFDPIDHPSYDHLTGWERIGTKEELNLQIVTGNPVSCKNPHYLAMDIRQPGRDAGVYNAGFHNGIYLKEGEGYLFSCRAKREQDLAEPLRVSLQDSSGRILAQEKIFLTEEWEKYEFTLNPAQTVSDGRLALIPCGRGKVYLDFVSLFPEDTYKGRKGGLRRDIAELLEDMHPKFMRFPGGCLTHDGALDPEARDAQYRWKNTVGPIEKRPARRNNWGYHQTLGLGFYELFQFCEDIGAKPLPVISPGYDPHHHREAPLESMQYFVEEALDLIEFANGPADSGYGSLRAQMGHPAPFGMEYLGIGNEEVGEPFFERYRIVADAVRARYPEIKLIGTSGPFAAGGEYERGWRHAREDGADLVDEHYYMAPQWFLANHHRYDGFSPEGPKVFLGEYASWGNTWYNALCEASFMIGLEKNAGAVGLACYAPMLCNVDYVNWKPDLIWFDSHRCFGSANYYVQKLFMENQGCHTLKIMQEDAPKPLCLTEKPDRIWGRIRLSGDNSTVEYGEIVFCDEDTGEMITYDGGQVKAGEDGIFLPDTEAANYSLSMKAKEVEGLCGFRIYFGEKDEKNGFCWSLGGWQNQDTIVSEITEGRNSDLSQYLMTVEKNREYELKLQVKGRRICTFIDGKKYHDIQARPVTVEALYPAAALDENGDILVKAVNVSGQTRRAKVHLQGLFAGTHRMKVSFMGGFLGDEENSFEHPDRIKPSVTERSFEGDSLEWEFPAQSITFFRIGTEK